MEKLNEYLKGKTARYLARTVGVSDAHMSDLRHGKRRPSLVLARRIKEATAGAVDYDAWGLA
jgi:transcriptional regulator with XRE-family HTH domain